VTPLGITVNAPNVAVFVAVDPWLTPEKTMSNGPGVVSFKSSALNAAAKAGGVAPAATSVPLPMLARSFEQRETPASSCRRVTSGRGAVLESSGASTKEPLSGLPAVPGAESEEDAIASWVDMLVAPPEPSAPLTIGLGPNDDPGRTGSEVQATRLTTRTHCGSWLQCIYSVATDPNKVSKASIVPQSIGLAYYAVCPRKAAYCNDFASFLAIP
jgi:hypothetical protein